MKKLPEYKPSTDEIIKEYQYIYDCMCNKLNNLIQEEIDKRVNSSTIIDSNLFINS